MNEKGVLRREEKKRNRKEKVKREGSCRKRWKGGREAKVHIRQRIFLLLMNIINLDVSCITEI